MKAKVEINTEVIMCLLRKVWIKEEQPEERKFSKIIIIPKKGNRSKSRER